MIDWRRLISAVIGGLVLTTAVYADMTPPPQLVTERQESLSVCSRTAPQYTNLSGPLNFTNVTDLDLSSVRFLRETSADLNQTSQVQHLQSLTEGSSSLSLCLSAMMGLGLCSSVHLVKKIHLGFIPEWYHNGGPLQIGHSLAVSPESLYPAPVNCFIQPVSTVERLISQHRLRTVVSLWRKSQFTPDVIASRGPPIS